MILNFEEHQKVWVISDTHYSHTNICKSVSKWSDTSVCRDYASLEEMNEAIVKVMNIPEYDDVIIHLGDWSFGGFENIMRFYNQIRCENIYLILGNHDHHIEKNKDGVANNFKGVNNYARITQGPYTFICTHYPIISWHNMNKGWIHLHGHVHLNWKDCTHEGRAMDVGFDGLIRLAPYLLSDIGSQLSKHPIKILSLPHDHHEKEIR